MERKSDLIKQLSAHVEKYQQWVAATFTHEQIVNGDYDAAGYPEWDEIERHLQEFFATIDFHELNDSQLDEIIYLIARNWDLGTIINWLYDDPALSQIGMTEEQFLVISKKTLHSSDWDARYQIAGVLYRVSEENKEQAIELLLKYHQDHEDYVRRMALKSLFMLNYSDLQDLIEKSWRYDEVHERMYCLALLKKMKSDQYEAYLSGALSDQRAYLREYAESLRDGKVDKS
jgi:DNA polymerase III delta prime subunit